MVFQMEDHHQADEERRRHLQQDAQTTETGLTHDFRRGYSVDLPLIMDSSLTWRPHIKGLANVATNTLVALYPLLASSSKLNLRLKVLLYNILPRHLCRSRVGLRGSDPHPETPSQTEPVPSNHSRSAMVLTSRFTGTSKSPRSWTTSKNLTASSLISYHCMKSLCQPMLTSNNGLGFISVLRPYFSGNRTACKYDPPPFKE